MPYVKDILKEELVVAKQSEKIVKISKVLTQKKISNIPIIDEQSKLVGIVSEQDIIKAMGSDKFMEMTAKEVMTKNVLSVKENDSLEYVSKIFTEHPYRRLPVVKNGKVVGIITREDIIQSFMNHYY